MQIGKHREFDAGQIIVIRYEPRNEREKVVLKIFLDSLLTQAVLGGRI